ncbi:AAA family ATPase [Candidatus Woesearchaeota archaeon]|nr:AAA family ATPase [Candidatus Woesearchaeota archaeon]
MDETTQDKRWVEEASFVSSDKPQFREVSLEEIIEFYKMRKQDRLQWFNDGSEEYMIAVINYCAQPEQEKEINKEITQGRLSDLFERATNSDSTKLLKDNRYSSFKFYSKRDNEGITSLVIIPQGVTEKEADQTFYQISDELSYFSFNKNNRETLITQILMKIVVYSGNEILDPEGVYKRLVNLNPDFSFDNVLDFKKRIDANPALVFSFFEEQEAKCRFPKNLQALVYEPKPEDNIRPGSDGINTLIESAIDSWKYGRSTKSFLFLGDPDTGKSTSTRYIAYRVAQESEKIDIFNMGKLRLVVTEFSPEEITKALNKIYLWSAASDRPCLILWDEITEFLQKNYSGDIERDKYLSAIKAMIDGEAFNNAKVMIIGNGNGNPSNIDSSFLTPKRFYKINLYEDPETRVNAVINSMRNAGFIELMGKKEEQRYAEVSEFINILPPEITTGILCDIVKTIRSSTTNPSFTALEKEVYSVLFGVTQARMKDLEINSRAAYVAGVITVALSLGYTPFAASINKTVSSRDPVVYFTSKETTLSNSIAKMLSYVGGHRSPKFEGNLMNNPIYRWIEKRTQIETTYLIEQEGVTLEGLYSMPSLLDVRREPFPRYLHEELREYAENFVTHIMTQNRAIYTSIRDHLQNYHEITFEDVLRFQDMEITVFKLPEKLSFSQTSSTALYEGGKEYTGTDMHLG